MVSNLPANVKNQPHTKYELSPIAFPPILFYNPLTFIPTPPETEVTPMDITYVCGHRNPDTDSIVAAMSYAALRNTLGDNGYVAARLGPPNDETAGLLRRFGFDPPVLLSTVRTQVRDLDFDQPPLLGKQVPVSRAWEILTENPGLSVLPVTEDSGTLFGLITAGGIAESDMRSAQNPVVESAPIFNVLSALEGRILNRDDNIFDALSGEVTIALPSPGGCLKGLPQNAIVLCGEQEDVVEKAL